ncbi:DUF899 domain-containing protein [Paenibacillus thalictri]|uniref:DUF899 domain-containing protein n=1 Tax=Paenibacillus thalictri TaxID=2527873 RepID=A0A4Q9DSH3_9BACL|nr:DUF899 domain-containing protein [Paenibacillus thalictri]TBL77835.1 DUF899 domain-containing protein [Paenibacillus thalictri]
MTTHIGGPERESDLPKGPAMPQVVTPAEWQAAREKLLVKEKELTRALDALAAERHRLPMVQFGQDYVFEGPQGTAGLLDLFDGRRQLIVYHFMMAPGSEHRCPGCSSFVDNIGHLAHLHARDTTFVLVSPAPFSQIEPFKRRMGWTVPWFSSNGNTFNNDCGSGGGFGLSVFLRERDCVFRTYFTTRRGADRIRADFNLLDLTAYGRQEHWEDSPEGWPQTPPYTWWRLHDEYET